MAKVSDSPEVDEAEDQNLSPENMAAMAIAASKAGKVDGEDAPAADAGEDDDDDQANDEKSKAKDSKPGDEGATQAIDGPKALLSRDGKHLIPYSRVEQSEAARDAAEKRAETAEAAQADLQRQLAEAQAAVKANEQAEAAGKKPAASSVTAEEIEADIAKLEKGVETMREEGADYLADQQEIQIKAMRRLLDRQQAIEQRDTDRQQQQEADAKKQQEEQERSAQETVQAAIDGNPAIKHWQTNKPAFFSAAGDIDRKLRELPEWKGKPYSERFEEVVKQMVAEYGETILPAGSAAPKPKKDDKPLPALKESGAKSLTDIPGGTPTSQTPLEDLENASPSDLSRAMDKMTPDEIMRFAARGGRATS